MEPEPLRLTTDAGRLQDLARLEGDGRRVYTARLYRVDVATRDRRRLRFAAGALDPDAEPVSVLYGHLSGNALHEPVVIGVTRRTWEADGAAWADFVFAKTAKAREVEQLVADGALSKVSVGVLIDQFDVDDETDETVVLAFDLAELSIVPVPAMRDAEIVADVGDPELVRLQPEGVAMDETTQPVAAEPRPDPGTSEIDARLAAIEDQLRERPAAPSVQVTTRTAPYRSVGSLIADVVAMDRRDDTAARDRLAELIADGSVRHDGRARIIDLAFVNKGLPGNAAPAAGYVPELLELLRGTRVTANLFGQRDLDEVPGSELEMPKVAAGATILYQAPGGAVANTAQDWDTVKFPKATLAGGQGVAVQTRDWSSPAYMDAVIADLVAAYGEKVNLEVVAGDGAAGPPAHHKGIMSQGLTPIDGATDLVLAIGTAKGEVFTGTKAWPTTLIASGVTLGAIDGMTGADGRPLLATDGPSNAIGTESGPSPAGRIRGLNAFADDAVPADVLVISNFRDAQLWESGGAPVQVALTYPDVLTIDVTVFGYSAVAIRRPGAFALVELTAGVVLAAQAADDEPKAKK